VIGEAVYSILSGSTTLTAKCSNISVLRELQGITAPFLVYSIDNVIPLQYKDGVSPIDEITLNIDIYSEYDKECNEIADIVRTLLERYSGTVETQIIQSIRFELQFNTFDTTSKLFYISQNYIIRHQK
jgi:hypothetical protein